MHGPFSLPVGNRVNTRHQAYALLLIGAVFLFIAWLGFLIALSLWLPGSGLFVLGLAALVANGRRSSAGVSTRSQQLGNSV